MKIFRLSALSLTPLFLTAFLLASASALAADRYVATTGSDAGPNDCLTQASPCLTISNAIVQAVPADRIIVAAGTYTFSVGVIADVNKQLELRGAQADVDARTRPNVPANESILTGVNGVLAVSADGVIVNGFTIEGETNGLLNGGGVFFQETISGYRFINNIVQNNIFGVYANSSGTTQSQLQFNLFQTNNNPGAASGAGIYSDYGSHDILIDSNQFTDNDNCGVVFDTFKEINTDVTIQANRFEQNGAGVCIFNSDSVTIQNNEILSSDFRGISSGGALNDLLIQNNLIDGNGAHGVRVGFSGDTGTQDNIQILGNQLTNNDFGIGLGASAVQSNVEIHFNRIFNNTTGGLDNAAANAADAENNWWGCNAGPNDAPGDCDTVTGPADFNPWLVLRLLADPAILPSGGTSDLLADLLQNSDGDDTSAAGNIPNDTPVGFSASAGTVNPASSVTTDGQSASTYSAAATGAQEVCTTVDNQEVCTQVTVTQATPIPTPTPVPPAFVGCLEGSGNIVGSSGSPACNGFSCSLGKGTEPHGVASAMLFFATVLGGLGALRVRRK